MSENKADPLREALEPFGAYADLIDRHCGHQPDGVSTVITEPFTIGHYRRARAALAAPQPAADQLREALAAFTNFIDEPQQYEHLRMVRDYRHELARKWIPLLDMIQAVRAARAPAAPCGSPEPWQNIDTILDVLEKAGCCRNSYVNAPEDVVANTLRDWLRSIQPAAPLSGREREAREECLRRGIDPDDICADGGVTAWMVVDQETREGRRHPIEILWRKHDLPEWFLGNGGTNTKLYALYDAIRAECSNRYRQLDELQLPDLRCSKISARTNCRRTKDARCAPEGQAMTRTKWRPIATAPKDEAVIVWCENDVIGEAYCNSNDDSWYWADGEKLKTPPKLWQPFPDPPDESEITEGERT